MLCGRDATTLGRHGAEQLKKDPDDDTKTKMRIWKMGTRSRNDLRNIRTNSEEIRHKLGRFTGHTWSEQTWTEWLEQFWETGTKWLLLNSWKTGLRWWLGYKRRRIGEISTGLHQPICRNSTNRRAQKQDREAPMWETRGGYRKSRRKNGREWISLRTGEEKKHSEAATKEEELKTPTNRTVKIKLRIDQLTLNYKLCFIYFQDAIFFFKLQRSCCFVILKVNKW